MKFDDLLCPTFDEIRDLQEKYFGLSESHLLTEEESEIIRFTEKQRF